MLHAPAERAAAAPTDCVRVIDGATVAIRQGTTTFVIAWTDIVAVRSKHKRTFIATANCVFKSSAALSTIVDALSSLGLTRIHRGAAVNAGRARRLAGHGKHRLVLTLDTGEDFLVGRQFQRSVRARFGFKNP